MKRTLTLFVVTAMLAIGLACSGGNAPTPAPPAAQAQVATAPAPAAPAACAEPVFATVPAYKAWAKTQAPNTVTIDEAKTQIEAGKFKAVVDVREPGEFAAGYLPGAINLPRGVLEFKFGAKLPDLPKDAAILIYCKEGARAALSARALARVGYTNVTSMAGGFEGWHEKGLPTTK
jgi:rhodanese-related sulfurtransferase